MYLSVTRSGLFHLTKRKVNAWLRPGRVRVPVPAVSAISIVFSNLCANGVWRLLEGGKAVFTPVSLPSGWGGCGARPVGLSALLGHATFIFYCKCFFVHDIRQPWPSANHPWIETGIKCLAGEDKSRLTHLLTDS